MIDVYKLTPEIVLGDTIVRSEMVAGHIRLRWSPLINAWAVVYKTDTMEETLCLAERPALNLALREFYKYAAIEQDIGQWGEAQQLKEIKARVEHFHWR